MGSPRWAPEQIPVTFAQAVGESAMPLKVDCRTRASLARHSAPTFPRPYVVRLNEVGPEANLQWSPAISSTASGQGKNSCL